MQFWDGGRIYIDDTTDVWNIFSTRVYDKGAWVLHMLRGIIGQQAFFDLLQSYYADPRFQYKDAVTEDFRDLAETVSGQDLDWFFEDWIYGYYFPRYLYSAVSRPRSDGRHDVFVHVVQSQGTFPQVFRMPIDLVITSAGVPDTVRVWNDQRDQDYWFILDNPGSLTQIDPLNWILDLSTSELYGLQMITDSLATGVQYSPYHDSLIAACRDLAAPLTFSIVAGALPDGLSLNSATGRISGSPLDTADTEVMIRVSTPGYPSEDRLFTLAVLESGYLPGDQNSDSTVDILDVVSEINYVFRAGAPPAYINAADPSGDCKADIIDVVTLIDYVWRYGPLPLPGCLQ
jgi:hypothetical protein